MSEPIPGLRAFIRESNRIEGILREPTEREAEAYVQLLTTPDLLTTDVTDFVMSVAGAALRTRVGMNVRVGTHRPPPGGPEIRKELEALLARISEDEIDPWAAHVAYETLHPFVDGNGRSGRAIWAWQVLHWKRYPASLEMGFLHPAYYAALAASREAEELGVPVRVVNQEEKA